MKRYVLWSVFLVATFIVIISALIYLPPHFVAQDISRHGTDKQIQAIDPDKYVLLIDEYRKTFAQMLGGFGLITTLFVSVLTLRSNEKAKIADRFARAFDHLGATRDSSAPAASEVRIGGVAELEGVGEDAPRERRMIRSAFSSYLRHYGYWAPMVDSAGEPTIWRMKETPLMLTVLSRWGVDPLDKQETRLTDLDLRHLILPPRANLAYVVADRSHFEYAQLNGIDFRAGCFHKASFVGANLRGADFRKAKLTNSNFVGAPASARQWGWNISESRFTWDAPTADADLDDADLRGTDLTGAQITEAQFNSARTDDSTIAPGSFAPAFMSSLSWRRRLDRNP